MRSIWLSLSNFYHTSSLNLGQCWEGSGCVPHIIATSCAYIPSHFLFATHRPLSPRFTSDLMTRIWSHRKPRLCVRKCANSTSVPLNPAIVCGENLVFPVPSLGDSKVAYRGEDNRGSRTAALAQSIISHLNLWIKARYVVTIHFAGNPVARPAQGVLF